MYRMYQMYRAARGKLSAVKAAARLLAAAAVFVTLSLIGCSGPKVVDVPPTPPPPPPPPDYLTDVPVTAAKTSAGIFEPVTVTAAIKTDDRERVDSIAVYSSHADSTPKLVSRLTEENNYSATLTYADTGSYSIRVRVYSNEWEDGEPYRDTAVTIRVSLDFGADPIDTTFSSPSGGRIPLKAKGANPDGTLWHWDLASLDLGTIIASGDTSVFVDKEVAGGVIKLSRIMDTVKSAAYVSVPLSAAFHRTGDVAVNVAKTSAGIFDPVIVTAAVKAADRERVDSIIVYSSRINTPPEFVARLTEDNNYSAALTYADTGSYPVSVRVYSEMWADGEPYRDTAVTIRVNLDFGADPIDITFASALGERVPLKAKWINPDGALWHWDLTDIGLGSIITPGDTSVFVDKEVTDGVIKLSRIRDTVKSAAYVSVPFSTAFYRIGGVPFTISDTGRLVFQPVTVSAAPAPRDTGYIDSVTLVYRDGGIRRAVQLTAENNFSASIYFADTGRMACSLTVYESYFEPRDTAFTVNVSLDYAPAGTYEHEFVSGGIFPLSASGTKPDGVLWGWDLTDIGRPDIKAPGDTSFAVGSGEVFDGVIYLYQYKQDPADSARPERSSPRIPVPVSAALAQRTVTVREHGSPGGLTLTPDMKEFVVTLGRDTSYSVSVPDGYKIDSVLFNGVRSPNLLTGGFKASTLIIQHPSVRENITVDIYVTKHYYIGMIRPFDILETSEGYYNEEIIFVNGGFSGNVYDAFRRDPNADALVLNTFAGSGTYNSVPAIFIYIPSDGGSWAGTIRSCYNDGSCVDGQVSWSPGYQFMRPLDSPIKYEIRVKASNDNIYLNFDIELEYKYCSGQGCASMAGVWPSFLASHFGEDISGVYGLSEPGVWVKFMD